MTDSSSATKPPASVGELVATEVERAILRNIKGLTYFASAAPAVGQTPKDRVRSQGTYVLYHYRPVTRELYRVPVLIVMAPSNRGYVFDLAPGQSLVEFLLKQGYDVYMIDWNAPRADEKSIRIEDYVLRFVPDAIDFICKDTRVHDVTVLGYCMGGVLSVIYAALQAGGPLKNLICIATPVDFSGMTHFHTWTDRRHFDVDRLVDSVGNIPPTFLVEMFRMIRPADRLAMRIRLIDNLWNDEYVAAFRRFDGWATDMLPLPGEYFRESIKELFWEGRLIGNTLRVGGRRVDLRKIKIPLLHVIADRDHFVPYEASRRLVESVGSRSKLELVLNGGHVSVMAGVGAAKRVWPRLDQWLGERST